LPGGVEWPPDHEPMDRKNKSPFCAATPAARPPAPALAVIAASPARCGSLPERRAARRSAAQRGLDQRLGMG
jgi:hypothetical protein